MGSQTLCAYPHQRVVWVPLNLKKMVDKRCEKPTREKFIAHSSKLPHFFLIMLIEWVHRGYLASLAMTIVQSFTKLQLKPIPHEQPL